MTQCYSRPEFFAIVPDVDRKMWTLAKGKMREGVYYCSDIKDLKRQLGKQFWSFVASILVPENNKFQGFDKEGNLQDFKQTNLYWACVWQCWKTKQTLWAKVAPELLRSQVGEGMAERGIWCVPTGYNFSHLSALRGIEWYDIEIYAKPEAKDVKSKESEVAK